MQIRGPFRSENSRMQSGFPPKSNIKDKISVRGFPRVNWAVIPIQINPHLRRYTHEGPCHLFAVGAGATLSLVYVDSKQGTRWLEIYYSNCSLSSKISIIPVQPSKAAVFAARDPLTAPAVPFVEQYDGS